MKGFVIIVCIAALLNLLSVANAQEFGILPYEDDEEPSQTVKTDCESGSDCEWCGNNCVLSRPGMICPAVMPPAGFECACIDRVCDEKKIEKTDEEPQPLQMEMRMIEMPYEVIEKAEITQEVHIGIIEMELEIEEREIVGGPLKIFECKEYKIIEIEPGEPLPSAIPLCSRYVVKHIEIDTAKALPKLPGNVGFADSDNIRNVSIISDSQTQLIRAEIVSNETGIHRVVIEKEGGNLILESNGVPAKASGVSIKLQASGIYMETPELKEEIKILPDTAADMASDAGIEAQEMKLGVVEQKPVYEIKGGMSGRILGIFPVTMHVETSVNAETGEVGTVEKPWWGFLVF